MIDAPPGARVRNPGIDLLRGLSIVLVVVHHTAIRMPLEKGVLSDWLPSWLLSGLQYNGFESVFLFFVISGFLITSKLVARFVSVPLERRLLRAGSSRPAAPLAELSPEVSP